MATIDPIHTKSDGGFDVEINEIDSTSHDCLGGTIVTANGKENARWDASGTMRGGTPETNLNPKDPALSGVIKRAEQIEESLNRQ